MNKLFVKRLSPHAVLPVRADDGAAGYDLSSAENTVVPAHGKALISTGWAMKIADGYYGRIAPRSGLAWKNHIDIGAGVVDKTYRGCVGVVLFNHSATELKIGIKDRVAQLIITKIDNPEVVEVEDLDVTVRGAGGFGSTGMGAIVSACVKESVESKEITTR